MWAGYPAVAAVASGRGVVLPEPRAHVKLRSIWEKVIGEGQIELLNTGQYVPTGLAKPIFGTCVFVSLPQRAQMWFSAVSSVLDLAQAVLLRTGVC